MPLCSKWTSLLIPVVSVLCFLHLWKFHNEYFPLVTNVPSTAEFPITTSSLILPINNTQPQPPTTDSKEPETTTSTYDSLLVTLQKDQQNDTVSDLLKNFRPELEPMWNCSADNTAKNPAPRRKKLIFVHVFKTAGSTFRAFMVNYAYRCHVGTTVIVQCSGVSHESILSSNNVDWKNAHGSKKGRRCVRDYGLFRNGTELQPGKKMTNQFLRNHVDILIGHTSVGVHENWKDTATNRTVDVQYMTFLREPIRRYVSGIVYSTRKRKMNFTETVQLIKDRVKSARKKDEYREGYSAYLLTPEQKDVVYNSSRLQLPKKGPARVAHRTNLILSNLVEHSFLVGIVERMHESLVMMQHVMDGQREVTPFFAKIGMNVSGAAEVPWKANEAKISTGAIVEELRRDSDFYSLLVEYVSFDAQVYDFGLEMHKRQYAWLQANSRN